MSKQSITEQKHLVQRGFVRSDHPAWLAFALGLATWHSYRRHVAHDFADAADIPRHPPAPPLAVSRFLHFLPLPFHHFYREWLFQPSTDWGAYAAGGLMLLARPSLLRRFRQLPTAADISYYNPPQTGPHSDWQKLDVYAQHRLPLSKAKTADLSPVFVFVHGGAWCSGNKMMYRLLGHQLDQEGFVTVVPGYRVYPYGKIDDQVADVEAALQWVLTNIGKYGGDSRKVFVCGHSSGSHVLAVLLLRKLIQGLPSPIAGYISLCAPFDLAAHYMFESWRGAHELSTLKPANNGPPDKPLQIPRPFPQSHAEPYSGRLSEQYEFSCFDNCSPCVLADKVPKANWQSCRFPPVLLLHGAEDGTVPASATEVFGLKLAACKGKQGVDVQVLPGVDHANIIVSLMLGNESSVMAAVRRFIATSPPVGEQPATRQRLRSAL